MMKLYVGVDNGVSGGLCAMLNGEIIGLRPMPKQQSKKITKGKSKVKNEIDICKVQEWVERLMEKWNVSSDSDFQIQPIFVIEEPGGSKSSQAAVSMAGSFHSLRAFVELAGYPLHRITPQSWQRVMLPGTGEDHTKLAAKAKCAELWPWLSFLRTDRCSTPDTGILDAALIAEWARRNNL